MRKYKKVLRDALEDIVCDICGKTCLSDCSMEDPLMAEYATIEGVWGYCSKRDGEFYKCDMCESCFEKVENFIKSLKSV
jgi:hypothetical protein